MHIYIYTCKCITLKPRFQGPLHAGKGREGREGVNICFHLFMRAHIKVILRHDIYMNRYEVYALDRLAAKKSELSMPPSIL